MGGTHFSGTREKGRGWEAGCVCGGGLTFLVMVWVVRGRHQCSGAKKGQDGSCWCKILPPATPQSQRSVPERWEPQLGAECHRPLSEADAPKAAGGGSGNQSQQPQLVRTSQGSIWSYLGSSHHTLVRTDTSCLQQFPKAMIPEEVKPGPGLGSPMKGPSVGWGGVG